MFFKLKKRLISFIQFVRGNVCFFDLFFLVLLLIFLLFYQASFSVFFGFVSGNIYCIAFELAGMWRYVLFRLKDRQQKYEVKVFFRDLSLEPYFNPDTKSIEERNKKRGYFINKYNADTSFSGLLPLENTSPSKIFNKETTVDKDKSLLGINSLKDFGNGFSPEKERERGKTLDKSLTHEGTNKKKKMNKVRYKHLKSEITDILEYFNELIKIETKYGDMLCELGEPKLFNQNIKIFVDEKFEKKYSITSLSSNHKNLISHFINLRGVKSLVLPKWSIFKIGVRVIGKAHKDCATFIKKGVNDMVYMFNNEYVQESQKMKKEKKDLKSHFDKSQTYLSKVSKEFKEQHENFRKLYSIYEESKTQREAPAIQYKKEGDAKMASLTYDSLKVKVREANNQNYEVSNKVQEMNKKIMDFNKDWYQSKQSSFATILRSIVDAFYENAGQYKDVFKEMIGLGNLPENEMKPKLKTKKSMILDSPLLPIEELKMVRSSLKRSANSQILEDSSDEIFERKTEDYHSENKKLFRKTGISLKESRENYFEFNESLKSLNINVEDEHLKDLDENELTQTFKLVYHEMNKKFDDYKASLNDSLKVYKEIKEVYLEELIKGKETYMTGLLELLNTKFVKMFSHKTGNYLKLFELVVQRLREYAENFREYLKILKDIHARLNECHKNGEKEKKEISETCAEHVKEFDRFLKNITESSKKIEMNGSRRNLSQELNTECIMKKNHMFPRINTEMIIFQQALERHKEKISEIKFDYLICSLDFIQKQKITLDKLVEEVDENYFDILNKLEDFEQIFKKEDEEDKNNAALEEIDTSKKPLNNSIMNEINAESSEIEDDTLNFDQKEKPESEEKISLIRNRACGFFLSKLFRSFFAEWSENPHFHERVRKKLYTSFNKKRNPLFDEIKIVKIIVDATPPFFEEIVPQKCEKNELTDMISDMILKKVQKMTYPNRKQLKIPMTNPKRNTANST